MYIYEVFWQYRTVTWPVGNSKHVLREHKSDILTMLNLFDMPFIHILSYLTDWCSSCAPPLQLVKGFYSDNYEAELMCIPDGFYGNSAVECRLP
jgi:hypothetical protein